MLVRLIREHKADAFVVAEKAYDNILDTLYKEYLAKSMVSHEGSESQFIQPIWLDIGGHVGSSSIKIHRRGASRIYTFEPEPFNFALLSKNTAYYDDIVPLNYAIVGPNNLEQFILYGNLGTNSGRHTLAPGLSDTHSVTRLPIKALQFSYVMNMTNAKCAKIDVEGAEHTFFDELLASQLEFVMMEYHCDDAARDGFIDYMNVYTAENIAIKKGWDFRIIERDDKYKTFIVVMTKHASLL